MKRRFLKHSRQRTFIYFGLSPLADSTYSRFIMGSTDNDQQYQNNTNLPPALQPSGCIIQMATGIYFCDRRPKPAVLVSDLELPGFDPATAQDRAAALFSSAVPSWSIRSTELEKFYSKYRQMLDIGPIDDNETVRQDITHFNGVLDVIENEDKSSITKVFSRVIRRGCIKKLEQGCAAAGEKKEALSKVHQQLVAQIMDICKADPGVMACLLTKARSCAQSPLKSKQRKLTSSEVRSVQAIDRILRIVVWMTVQEAREHPERSDTWQKCLLPLWNDFANHQKGNFGTPNLAKIYGCVELGARLEISGSAGNPVGLFSLQAETLLLEAAAKESGIPDELEGVDEDEKAQVKKRLEAEIASIREDVELLKARVKTVSDVARQYGLKSYDTK